MLNLNIMYFIIFSFILLTSIHSTEKKNVLYGNISKEKYLIGDYSPKQNFLKYFEKANGRTFYIRKDVYKSYLKMKKSYHQYALKNNLPIKDLVIVSAFRSFDDQKNIWNNKFNGKTKMRKSIDGKTDKEKVQLILEYSSAPGTSRHHWGTDLDLNSLNNSYFEKGKGKSLYNWLVKNAVKFGFCQPYNSYPERNHQGYLEEKWHWSYKPVSSKLLSDWNKSYHNNHLIFKNHSGSNAIQKLRTEYVNSINKDCK